jgi:hypothetical protein
MPDFKLQDILTPLRYFERRYNYINKPSCKFKIKMQRMLIVSYSKAAILEFCGWIEESIDDMFKKYAIINISNPQKRKMFLSKLKRTYGFKYDKHLYSLISLLLTPPQLRKYSLLVQKRQFLPTFKQQLETLSDARNDAAHKNLVRCRKNYDSPSIVINTSKQIKSFLNSWSSTIGSSIR